MATAMPIQRERERLFLQNLDKLRNGQLLVQLLTRDRQEQQRFIIKRRGKVTMAHCLALLFLLLRLE